MTTNNKTQELPSVTPAEFTKKFDEAMSILASVGVSEAVLFSMTNLVFDTLQLAKYTEADGVTIQTNGVPSEFTLGEDEIGDPMEVNHKSSEQLGGKFVLVVTNKDDHTVNVIASAMVGKLIYGEAIVMNTEKGDV